MKTSQTGVDLIKKFEGCVLKAYKDPVGVLTIGYGHTGSVKAGQVITKAKAEELLKGDLKRFEDGVEKYVRVSLNQNQFDALVSFSYNLGLGNLQSSDLLEYINKKDFKSAAKEIPLWCHAGGKVLAGLVKRRAAEMALFVKPVATKKAAPKATTASDKYKVKKSIGGYVTAANAKDKKSKRTTVKAGSYYVFNKSAGMINVTTKKGVPGSWINPSENK